MLSRAKNALGAGAPRSPLYILSPHSRSSRVYQINNCLYLPAGIDVCACVLPYPGFQAIQAHRGPGWQSVAQPVVAVGNLAVGSLGIVSAYMYERIQGPDTGRHRPTEPVLYYTPTF